MSRSLWTHILGLSLGAFAGWALQQPGPTICLWAIVANQNAIILINAAPPRQYRMLLTCAALAIVTPLYGWLVLQHSTALALAGYSAIGIFGGPFLGAGGRSTLAGLVLGIILGIASSSEMDLRTRFGQAFIGGVSGMLVGHIAEDVVQWYRGWNDRRRRQHKSASPPRKG